MCGLARSRRAAPSRRSNKVTFYSGEDHLALGIAKAGIILNHIRVAIHVHQPEEDEAPVVYPFSPEVPPPSS
ncbi:MAG: hypothetical protein MZV63_44190 [Marinilabiliales bacterium]|nr:hypothetical protein [Marinilabiliales bacterium]